MATAIHELETDKIAAVSPQEAYHALLRVQRKIREAIKEAENITLVLDASGTLRVEMAVAGAATTLVENQQRIVFKIENGMTGGVTLTNPVLGFEKNGRVGRRTVTAMVSV